MTSAAATARRRDESPKPRRRYSWRRAVLHGFLIAITLLWLLPLAWALYTSLRPFEETAVSGYVSLPQTLNFDNFIQAWNQAELFRFFLNTLVIVVPAVLIVLFLGSMMAFSVSRYSWKFNLSLLMMFTALNLLPPQVIITPLFQMFIRLPLPENVFIPGFPSDNGLIYDQYAGMVLIHVAFQLGFVTFVLSNYMKTLPKELNEAALVDGASVWRTYRSIILPLTRPALAALGTLEFTFIYNDFFWGLMLMKTGSKFPITSALNNLKGQFFVDNNLIAAGAILVALPTLIVFFALQKHFISGLTLGSTKG
ncbi:MAG: carbohydrate ABC transporter permease [Chloroflexota bacterium]